MTAHHLVSAKFCSYVVLACAITSACGNDGSAIIPGADARADDMVDSADATATPPTCNAWIVEQFSAAPVVTGTFTTRQFVEMPVFVRDADASASKYAFDLRDASEPADPRAAFCMVQIHDMATPDPHGSGILTPYAPITTVFLSHVTIEPNWPNFVDYATTNKDGMVLDSQGEAYGEDVTVRHWNADAAIDNKTPRSEWVRLKTAGGSGGGVSALKLWRGIHYVVDSTIDGDGNLVEFAGDGIELRVWNSMFAGLPTVPADRIWQSEGTGHSIVYLPVDPRTTGEMHPMFH